MISVSEKVKHRLTSMNQKIYLTMYGFIRIIKYNKSKTPDNDFDLHGESLEDISEKHKITIYHENTKYTFKLFGKYYKSFSFKCDSFFVEAEAIKNPYTNIPFNLSTLYSIYFVKKLQSILYFFKCHKSQFCIHKFKATYKPTFLMSILKTY